MKESIKKLKYNIGDWNYPYFNSLEVLTEDELTENLVEFPDDDYLFWKGFDENLMGLFCGCLFKFTNTEPYKRKLKTKHFISFCTDHSENFEKAAPRFKKVELNNGLQLS